MAYRHIGSSSHANLKCTLLYSGYVLEVEGAAVANARVILNHCPDMQDKIQTEAAEQDQREKEEAQAQIDADLLQANA